MIKKVMALLMVASFMAGCADAIPDLPGTEEEVVVQSVEAEKTGGDFDHDDLFFREAKFH